MSTDLAQPSSWTRFLRPSTIHGAIALAITLAAGNDTAERNSLLASGCDGQISAVASFITMRGSCADAAIARQSAEVQVTPRKPQTRKLRRLGLLRFPHQDYGLEDDVDNAVKACVAREHPREACRPRTRLRSLRDWLAAT